MRCAGIKIPFDARILWDRDVECRGERHGGDLAADAVSYLAVGDIIEVAAAALPRHTEREDVLFTRDRFAVDHQVAAGGIAGDIGKLPA